MFTVSKTFQVVTQESASRGDFSEDGFEFEDSSMSLRDLLDEVNSLGYFEVNGDSSRLDLYGVDPDTDYQTGDETTFCLHIDGPSRAVARLKRLINKKRLA
jgi:hypothetical protein